MGLNTNFNQSPYFDDFDEQKNYHRILFKPAVAVQARELTQLQTILQNQIERFGDNILIEGTIVQGGNFVEERSLPYVKVRDIAFNTSGGEVSTDVNQYVGMKAVGQTTGVEAIIIATEFGLESQTPDLNTLFVRYTKGAISANNTNISAFNSTEQIVLYSQNASGDYIIPNHRLTVAGLVDAQAIGFGYGVRCGSGIIYQKGHFIRFEDELTIVSKYTSAPDGVVVGFQTIEELVDSNADSSLLDNANGFNNESAPGADRLKLTPSLVVKTLAEAEGDDTFFAIQEYANGKVIRRKLSTQYNYIEKALEQRTVEESGNYTVNRFPVSVNSSSTNNQIIDVVIGAGLGYVEGKRIELLNELTISIPEANTFAVVSDQTINTNYGNYIEVENLTGNFNFTTYETVNLRNAADNATLGTARIRAVMRIGTGSTYRLYIFQIAMASSQSFDAIRKIKSTTSTGSADVILVSGKARAIDTNFNNMFFPIGRSFIRSVDGPNTDFIYRTSVNSTITTATLTITLGGANDVFPYTPSAALNSDQRAELIVIANAAANTITSGEVLTATAASLDATGKVLTITLNKNPGASLSVTSHLNVKRIPTTVNNLSYETVYVKIQANTNPANTAGPWSLGIPNAVSLVGVWQGTSATSWETLEGFAANNSTTNNITSSLGITGNQSDNFYGISALRKTKTITIGANDKLIAKVRAFRKDVVVGHFFTVDSYPVDDVTIPLPETKIRTESIPVYTASNGGNFYLRDVLDLRPYAANTAVYATTANTATINPSSTVTFSNLITPTPNEFIETTYSYYLGRNDLVMINKRGDFTVLEGTPAETPTWPAEPDKGLVIGRLSIPPYPSLPGSIANRIGKPDYGVSISSRQPRRYTMQDIGGIEQRLNNLEYYTSLSLLETSAKDFLVTDAAGLDRFKNGIFVDNFENLFLANVNGGEFIAAIYISEKNIHPSFRQYPLDLTVKSLTNATNHNNLAITMSKSDVALSSVSQPYASGVKNLTTSFYKYNGWISIKPEYDSGPDTVRAPNLSIDIDLATPFMEFTEQLSKYVPLARTSTDVETKSRTKGNTTTTTTTRTTTTKSLDVTKGKTQVDVVGNFITDVQFSPFMRSRDIKIRVGGLRPNTRFYFFFDGISVNEHVAKGQLIDGEVVKAGSFGNPVAAGNSDANGKLYAIFRIPEGQFFVGDRTLLIMDVDTIANIDAATSSASVVYSAYNFSATKTKLTTSTRPPKFSTDISTKTSVSTTTRTENAIDPLAQSFIISSNLSDDTDLFVTKLDLFFARRSKTNGVTVQIREMENGYPTSKIVPFGSVYLEASDVVAHPVDISTTATNKTTVVFPVPVALKVDTEYCIVLMPDGNDPNYLAFISRTGETDIDTDKRIVQDTNAGVLFTSTNNLTWTPYQNENLKFTLYAAKFTGANATVALTNQAHEFFAVANTAGTFKAAESVFIDKTTYLTGSVSITAGNTTVTGSGTSFTTQYQAGNHIIVRINATTYDVLKIKTVNSNTSMTLQSVPTYTASGVTSHFTSPVGQVTYYDTSDPAILILENSTANSQTFKFSNGDLIRGEDSTATASITTVRDLPISYIQPAIYHTNFTKTKTTLSATRLDDGVSSTNTSHMAFNATNYMVDKPYYIKSRSNDLSGTSFELTVAMENDNTTDTSPVLDHSISSILVAEYIVNNDSTNETTSIGNALAKYVSKKVELNDGLDAEDLRVILNAYRPAGTSIEVYAKFQSQYDNRNFSDIEWTKLELKPETDASSSKANMYDYREYDFGLGTVSKLAGQGAWSNAGTINYIDSSNAIYKDFKFFAIKIVMLASSHNIVPRINDLRALALS
jgi:hypothetical protein